MAAGSQPPALRIAGVPTTTLRAWERRYGLLKPSRTAKGHRLYSGEDIDLVKEIVKLLKSNHTISEAIRIIRNPELNALSNTESEGHWAVYQQRMLTSIENFNEHFKAIFDVHGAVPTKGLLATQRFVLSAVFVYQLAILYCFLQNLDLRIGLKALLKAA